MTSEIEILATGEGTFIAAPGDELERLKRRYGPRRLSVANGDATTTADTTGSVDRM